MTHRISADIDAQNYFLCRCGGQACLRECAGLLADHGDGTPCRLYGVAVSGARSLARLSAVPRRSARWCPPDDCPSPRPRHPGTDDSGGGRSVVLSGLDTGSAADGRFDLRRGLVMGKRKYPEGHAPSPVGEPIPTIRNLHRIEMHVLPDIWTPERDGCSMCCALRAQAMPYIAINLMAFMSGMPYRPHHAFLGFQVLPSHALVLPETEGVIDA